ncbi:MAG: pantoate--beta-alanine ligase [Pelobium sp.]
MKIFTSKADLSNFLNGVKNSSLKIGLVPTMGALHKGHISLIDASKKVCDLTIATVFVNPTQFNNKEDLLKYPKPILCDLEMLEIAGCDIVFNPETNEMYQDGEIWDYQLGDLNTVLEGKFRPGHYLGVTQIVFKLFDLIKPDIAFFGQKDYQQFLVIQKMNMDMNLGIELKACPIVREEDGLAMSSRNVRLSKYERREAITIYQSLVFIKENFLHYTIEELLLKAKSFYTHPSLSLDYLVICDKHNLNEKLQNDKNNAIVLVACNVGDTRLIDNMILS